MMGEMCDFEKEYYPENWDTDRIRYRKKKKVRRKKAKPKKENEKK